MQGAELPSTGRVYTEQNKYALCSPLWAKASCAIAAAMASTRNCCSFVIWGTELSSQEEDYGDLREDMNLSLEHTFSHEKSTPPFGAPQAEDCLTGEGTPHPPFHPPETYFLLCHMEPQGCRLPQAASRLRQYVL